jgi:hypothetical protein
MLDLKELREKGAKQARKILHTFDFDDTLFKPIPEVWIEDVVSKAQESIKNGETLTVLITGRKDQPAERRELEGLLREKKLSFDEVFMNDSDEDSPTYKVRTLQVLRKRFPTITTVRVWENDPAAKTAMIKDSS